MSENALTPDRPRSRNRLAVVLIASLLITFLIFGALLLSGGMRKVMAWYLLQVVPPIVGLLCLVIAAIAAAVHRRWDRGTTAAVLLSVLAILPVILMFVPVAYPASLERTLPAATVRLPADVPLQVIWGGDRLETNQHAVVADQRWAYDFVVAPYFSGSVRLEDYGCYGVTVVAPAAGLVTIAHDGEPDAVPGVVSNNYTAPEGNYVVIKLETGTYLLIAHLKPGSVSVEPGQRVAEGEPVGQCGNSGNTSEPHLHYHLQDGPDVMAAEGLPAFFTGLCVDGVKQERAEPKRGQSVKPCP